MRKKEKDEYSVKFYKSPFMIIGLIFMLIVMYGLLSFEIVSIIIFENVRKQYAESPFLFLFFVVFLFVIPTILFIFLMPRGFTKIVINKNGIETSLCKVFYKQKIAWSEVEEIRFGWRICFWVYLSKKKGEFENTDYEKLVKNRNVLQIELRKKVYKAILHYCDRPIEGIPDNIEKKLR